METKLKWKNPAVFLTVMLLIVSNSNWLAKQGIESLFEFGAYFVMCSSVFFSFLCSKCSQKTLIGTIVTFIVVSVLFCAGIAVQGLSVFTRLKLMATMVAISAVILAEGYINSWDTLRAGAYGILCGTAVTTLISLVTGVSVMEMVHDGFMSYGFAGGVQYKNFFGAFMLGSFMSLYFYNRYHRKHLMDGIVMVLELVLIFLSSARGTYIFLVVFLIVVNCDRVWAFARKKGLEAVLKRFWQRLALWQRVLLAGGVAVTVIAGCVMVYLLVVSSSATYGFRFRGVRNYLSYARGDWFHLLFGNAEMAWSGTGANYVETLRMTLGLDGTYEMGFINTLIKNGIVGLVGFAVMYVHLIRVTVKSKNKVFCHMNLTLLSVLLVSALVESFVCNIHSIFGVYCYLVMAGFCGMSRPKDDQENLATPLELARSKWDKLKRARGEKES